MTYMDLVPGDYSNAPTDADIDARRLLASEPKCKQGLKTPFNKEGDRTITYTWTVGQGRQWEQTMGVNPVVTFTAVLTITHNKKGRGAAHYSATLWQHQIHADGIEGIAINGRNGLRVVHDTAGAGRFSLAKLQAFAPYALDQLRAKADDPKVLAYFQPERV